MTTGDPGVAGRPSDVPGPFGASSPMPAEPLRADPGTTNPQANPLPAGSVPAGPLSGGPAVSSGRPARPPRPDRPPLTPADAGAWLFLGLAGFVAGQVLSLVLLAVVATLSGHGHDYIALSQRAVPPGWIVVTELVGVWIGFVGAVVLASRLRGTGRVGRDMGLRFRPVDLLLGPAIGLFGQLLLLPLLYVPLEHVVPHLQTRLSQPANRLTGGFPGADVAVIAVLTVVVVPIVEELLFRGLVLRAFVRLFRGIGALGPALACVATGIVFGAAHLEGLQLLGLAAFGIVLAALAYRTDRIGATILAHATFNLVAVVSVSGTLLVR